MNNIVEKSVYKSGEKMWGKSVEKFDFFSFPQKNTIRGKILHVFSIKFSTSFYIKITGVDSEFSIVST